MSKNDEFPIELTDLEKFNLKISGNYYTDEEKNPVKALEAYLKLANAGDASAMISVGMIYEKRDTPFGKALPGGPDDDAALKWYKKALNAGYSDALYFIANHYACARNDNAEALKWYKKCVDAQNLYGMEEFAKIYIDGKLSLPKDYKKAMQLYLKMIDIAKSKNEKSYSLINGMFKIGELYYKGGYGVEKNYVKALDWYLKAVEADMNRDNITFREEYAKDLIYPAIGKIYDEGSYGVKQDLEEALYYYEKTDYPDFFVKKRIKELKSQGVGSGCFITTAVCQNFGKADDCYELTAFRNFRDTWLINQADGKNLIAQYYEIAPKIVKKINCLPNAAKIYKNIWSEYLQPSLNLIEADENSACKKIYVDMVNTLRNKFLN